MHFPWCVRKCPYCDFNSHPLKDDSDRDGYIAALLVDWAAQQALLPRRELVSVFLGGGTPSLFDGTQLARVLDALRPALARDAEITLEANPGTVEHAPWDAYRTAGVNRLSLGAQSFAPAQLKNLGRIHHGEDTERAFDDARRAGFDNINLDLMHGLPEQTVEAALADLEKAISLQPEHISWYQLTLEPKTEFARRPPRLPGEATLATIEQAGLAMLADAGYERYEISAFAQNAHRARHNLNYWRFGDYYGVGAGAHGKWTHDAGQIERTKKVASPRAYSEQPAALSRRKITAQEKPGEFLMNALRLKDGVPRELFETHTGLPLSTIGARWAEAVALGLVREDRLATTPLGYRHLDSVLTRFL